MTHGIRSFTTLPYVFTTLGTGRNLLDAATEQTSYMLVQLAPGADRDATRKALAARLPDAEILTA